MAESVFFRKFAGFSLIDPCFEWVDFDVQKNPIQKNRFVSRFLV